MDEGSRDRRNVLLEEVLGAVREEALRRLTSNGWPLTWLIPASAGVSPEEGRLSPYEFDRLLGCKGFRDDTVRSVSAGFRAQLQPLANYLEQTTDLASRDSIYANPFTSADRILAPLAHMAAYYLRRLSHDGALEIETVAQLSLDLDAWCDPARVVCTEQAAIYGVQVDAAVEYRGVKIRSLSLPEQEHARPWGSGAWESRATLHSDFVAANYLSPVLVTTLIKATTQLDRGSSPGHGSLLFKVALAFFLHEFDIGGVGWSSRFEAPIWASNRALLIEFPVKEKLVVPHCITDDDVKSIIDLAYRIPDFSLRNVTREDIVFGNILRAAGASHQERPLPEYVTALEAALLHNVSGELSYRFSLYGALYLRDRHPYRDAAATFKRFRSVYSARSTIVHGEVVSSEKAQVAHRDVAELAKAVARKAAETCLPEPKKLDGVALGGAGPTDI